jgi:ribosomal protein S18 acetylase RimI-like enzyme
LSHQHRILFRFEDAKIICNKDVSIGLLKSYCDESGLNIVQVQISPQYQGKGIGAKLLSNLIKQAEDEGKQVTLSVLRGNPVKDLYERLGFIIISERDVEYTMRYKPNKNNHLD